MAGHCVWMVEFVPVNSPQKCLVESLLWHPYSEGVCCAVSRLFLTRQAGRFKQFLFVGLYIAICGIAESETVRILLQHGTNSGYFTLRELNFTLLSPYLPRGYGFQDIGKKTFRQCSRHPRQFEASLRSPIKSKSSQTYLGHIYVLFL
jgi:hypothetical protein